MMIPLECPTCGKTTTQSGEWTNGGFRGTLLGGLTPETCAGCWDTLAQSGASPIHLTPTANGGYASELIPRPASQEAQSSLV
jgi:hypothetical protein